jgi:hypothetical protein
MNNAHLAPVPGQALPSGQHILRLQDTRLATPGWPGVPQPVAASAQPGAHPNAAADPSTPLWACVESNHHHNACLWAQEDLARRTRVSDADIAANKRAIDRHNQARNDAVERIDEHLLIALGLVTPESAHSDAPDIRSPNPAARLNSETAGAMIDRLSILALKTHAMQAQTRRDDVDHSHRQLSQARLLRLNQQRTDLAACLDQLLIDTLAGTAWFKVYRQFKMYNDPAFNPALVAEANTQAQPKA